jgi:hypothetical protein
VRGAVARGGNDSVKYASGQEVGVEDQAGGDRPGIYAGSPQSTGTPGPRGRAALSPSSVVPLNQDMEAL